MRITVLGSGGVGGYYGARLALAGADVTFVARGRHLDALRTGGIRIRSPAGDLALPEVAATGDPARLEPADVVIVAVKSWQLDGALPALSAAVGPRTAVLPLLNGVEAYDLLARVVGPERVLKGMTRIISYVGEPGEIVHVGGDPYIAFGEADDRRTPRVERLLETLIGAGVRAEIPPDVDVAVWRKFLMVVSLGGVAAVTRSSFGSVRSVPECRALLEGAMGEIEALARVRGVALPDGTVDTSMALVDALPADGTASLQRDLMEGRRSELDAWNGAVVRLGRESNLAVPIHGFIYSSLLPAELQAREKRAPPDS